MWFAIILVYRVFSSFGCQDSLDKGNVKIKLSTPKENYGAVLKTLEDLHEVQDVKWKKPGQEYTKR